MESPEATKPTAEDQSSAHRRALLSVSSKLLNTSLNLPCSLRIRFKEKKPAKLVLMLKEHPIQSSTIWQHYSLVAKLENEKYSLRRTPPPKTSNNNEKNSSFPSFPRYLGGNGAEELGAVSPGGARPVPTLVPGERPPRRVHRHFDVLRRPRRHIP